MDEIVEIIKKKIADLGGNQSEVARQVGVSSQLLGKYLNGSEPGISFALAWKKAFGQNLIEVGAETLVSRETTIDSTGNHPHTEKLIQVLENRMVEEKRILEKQNNFLQDLIKSNLTGLAQGQSFVQAQLKAVLKLNVETVASGDPKKANALNDRIDKQIVEDFEAISKGGIPAGDGK